MSHYENLGVAEDASPAEIKRAYRARARKAHPDKGGDKDEFVPIVQAYETLMNPERRQLYDATGKDKRDPIEEEVRGTLLGLLGKCLAEVETDVLGSARRGIKERRGQFQDEKEHTQARKDALLKKRSRFRSMGETNLFHMIIDQEIKACDVQIIDIDHQIEIGGLMLLEWELYT